MVVYAYCPKGYTFPTDRLCEFKPKYSKDSIVLITCENVVDAASRLLKGDTLLPLVIRCGFNAEAFHSLKTICKSGQISLVDCECCLDLLSAEGEYVTLIQCSMLKLISEAGGEIVWRK